MKKLISLLLVGIMLVCALPVSADDAEVKYTVTVDGVAYEYAAGETVLIREPVFEAAPAMRSNEGASKMYKFNGFTVEGAEVENTDKRLIELVVPENDVTITTSRLLHGDVNGDDKTNAQDVFAIRMAMASNSISEYQAEYDVYPDSKVNAKDVLAIRKTLAGVFDYEAYEDGDLTLSAEKEEMIIKRFCELYGDLMESTPDNTYIDYYLGTYKSEKYGEVVVVQIEGDNISGGWAITPLIINGYMMNFPNTWTPVAYVEKWDDFYFMEESLHIESGTDGYNTISITDMFTVDDALEMYMHYRNSKDGGLWICYQ